MLQFDILTSISVNSSFFNPNELFESQVIDEYSNDVHFVEIDIEEDPEIAEAGGVMGTPTVQFFKNKQMIK